jgi:hypothetical protein
MFVRMQSKDLFYFCLFSQHWTTEPQMLPVVCCTYIDDEGVIVYSGKFFITEVSHIIDYFSTIKSVH